MSDPYDLFLAFLNTPLNTLIILTGVVAILCGALRSFAPLKAFACTAVFATVLLFVLLVGVKDAWGFLFWQTIVAILCLGSFIVSCALFQRETEHYFDQQKATKAIALGTATALFGIIFAFYNYSGY